MARLRTRVIHDPDDMVEHFDRLAEHYCDTHGPAERLLAYRLEIIRHLLADATRGTLLELGCGTGIHLIPLAAEFEHSIGIDVSPQMVRVASRNAARSTCPDRISVRVDSAHTLASVADDSVDAVLCVGVLEHLLDRPSTARQIYRVLRPDGVLVCLTPNGGYFWYRHLAPLLRLETRHLSTDRFLTTDELVSLLEDAGLRIRDLHHWQFVPRGDMPGPMGMALGAVDRVGRLLALGRLRGGIAVSAVPGSVERATSRGAAGSTRHIRGGMPS